MATYVPNATQTTEPVESRTVESAALEFRTLKESVNTRIAALTADFDALEAVVTAEDAKDLRVPEAAVAPLPAIAARAGKVLAFDAGGDPTVLVVGESADSSLRTDLAASSGSSLVGYQPAGTGAVATTVQSKLREFDLQLYFPTVASLLSSTKAGIGAGTIWAAGKYRYQELTGGDTSPGMTTAGGVKLGWLDDSDYSLEYFGIVNEASPVTDQRAQVQKMLDFLADRTVFVSGSATVGIAAPVYFSSGTTVEFEGLTLFGLASWGTTTFAVVAKQVQNVRVKRLTMNGNASAFGGLSPVVPTAGPRGFVIWDGCNNVYFEDCVSKNSNSNGFISYAGGGNDSSDSTGFIRCISDTCGVGMGQEIWTLADSAETAKPGPQNVLYDDCKTINCNTGLYLAGGTWDVRGGYFEAKRNQTLVMYCGDAAWKTTPAKGNISGKAKFVHLGTDAANTVVVSRGIAVAPTLATYGQQPECEYNVMGAEFENRSTTAGNIWIAYEGPNVNSFGCKFKGSLNQVDHRVDPSAPSGTYREGKVTLVSPVFSNWGSSSISASSVKPIEIVSGTWIEPDGASADCVTLTTNSDIILRSPVFGSVGATKQPRLGVANGSGSVPKRFVCQDAINNGLTSGFTNAPASVRPYMIFERSTPTNAFDRKSWVLATVAPTTGTWERGEIVWNSSPSASGFAGWICVAAGTPGTWKTFGVISA